MRNLLVAQSGGPTSAINATIAGVIMEAHASDQIDTIYGAVNGIKGVLEERFVNLSEKVPGEEELEILCHCSDFPISCSNATPSSSKLTIPEHL